MPLDEKTLLKKMKEDLGDPEVLAELQRLKKREYTLDAQQRSDLKRLREHRWSDRFSEANICLEAGFAALEANLLTSGSPSADAIRERSRALLPRIAEQATLAQISRSRMAHELAPVLCDGLEHPSPPVRLIAANGFLPLITAQAFRPPTQLNTAINALVRCANGDAHEGVALEASRQLWLLMRAHALDTDIERITLTRPTPHPHLVFYFECARASILNAALPLNSGDFHAPEWPELTPPLPNIGMAFTLYDDHGSSTTTCSFAQAHPSPDTRESTLSRCGVCASGKARIVDARNEADWEHVCETCGCLTRGGT